MEPEIACIPELTRLAREALANSGGDKDRAVASLRVQVGRSRELYLDFVEPLLFRALRYVIDSAIDGEVDVEHVGAALVGEAVAVRAAASIARRTSAPSPLLLAGVAAVARRNLMMFELSGGMKLGDATHDDLMRECIACELLADAQLKQSRWLKAIAERLVDRRSPVRGQITHDQLERLLHESMADAPTKVATR